MYVKGICKNSPNTGGWAAHWTDGSDTGELHGCSDDSTSNIMELTSVIKGLSHFTSPRRIIIHSDNEYVRVGATTWLEGWKANNWKNSKKKKVKNLDLWMELDAIMSFHDVAWKLGKPGDDGMIKAVSFANMCFAN